MTQTTNDPSLIARNTRDDAPSYFIPALEPVYEALKPLSFTWLRIITGIALMVHGWPKITNPLGAVDMVEGIGFAPGWFWSIALSVTEFFAGLLLLLGLATRIAGAGATVILAVTVYFHWIALDQGYRGAELSILWASITLFFVAHGGGRYSLDRLFVKREV